ncbi:MAG: MFS transporter [Lysobacterales bacterium]
MSNATPPQLAIPLLSLGQGLLLTGSAMLVSVNGLAGLLLAPDPHWATLPVTSFVLGGALSTLPISLLMQRQGRPTGFAVGCLAAICGALLAAVAIATGSFALLCLGTFVFGIYNASGQYLRFAAADLCRPGQQARAMSWVLAGGMLGAFLGPALSRLTLDLVGTHFLGTYLGLIGVALLVYAVTRVLRFPPMARPAAQAGRARLRDLLRRPDYVLAVAASAGAWSTMNLLMTASPLAMQACGYPFADAAFALQWHMVGMYAPMLVSGLLIERIGIRPAMVLGILGISGCAGIALAGHSVSHFVIALALLGIGWSLLFSAGNALLTRQYQAHEKGLAQGVHDALMFTSMVASSLLAGRAVTLTGWIQMQQLALLVMAGLLLWVSLRSVWARAAA